MRRLNIIVAFFAVLILQPSDAVAWNIPGHMVNGEIAYQIVQRDSPATIPKVRTILEKHPWYADRWRDDIAKLPDSQRDEMLFMLAARWSDDIRTRNASESHLTWHFINWPFKPGGEPESVRPLPPNPDNILSAFAENERIVRRAGPDDQRGVALAWLFHLVGDIHQPLHTVQLFTQEYPNGDRGGNEMCVRASLNGAPIELHRLWDGIITSNGNINRLRNIASDSLRRFSASTSQRTRSSRAGSLGKRKLRDRSQDYLRERESAPPRRGQAKDCRAVNAVTFLSTAIRLEPGSSRTGECTAGYRLANLLRTIER